MPDGAPGSWRDALANAGWILVATLAAFGRAAPAIGVADSIPRVVHELAPPRIAGLRRTVVITSVAGLLLTGGLALLAAALVPLGADPRWDGAPLAGLAQFLAPSWIHTPLTAAIVIAAGLMLAQTTRAGIWGAEAAIVRLAQRGTIGDRLKQQHPRFGTYSAAIDSAALASALAIVVSGASVTWLGCAYATAVLWTLALQAAALARLSAPATRLGVRLIAGALRVRGARHADPRRCRRRGRDGDDAVGGGAAGAPAAPGGRGAARRGRLGSPVVEPRARRGPRPESRQHPRPGSQPAPAGPPRGRVPEPGRRRDRRDDGPADWRRCDRRHRDHGADRGGAAGFFARPRGRGTVRAPGAAGDRPCP